MGKTKNDEQKEEKTLADEKHEPSNTLINHDCNNADDKNRGQDNSTPGNTAFRRETDTTHSRSNSAVTIGNQGSGLAEEKNSANLCDDSPDGGYGWLVVLGAFMVQISSFGTITSWGVMQNEFRQTTFKDLPNADLQLSFVGTIALICTNLMGPFAQILASIIGIRAVLILGTFCVTLGLEMAGFSWQIWHLYLTQGILFGSGASLMYVTIMGVAPQWFKKRLGMALGIVASGSGIGGLIIPFIMTPINDKLGAGWTYRILGFLCFAFDLVAVAFVKERNPPPNKRKRLRDIVQFDVLKNVNYLIWCLASVVSLFGYFVPFFFLPSYAAYLNLSNSQGSALVAVSSTCNFIGRVLAGLCADKIGKINTNIIFTILGGLSSLLIWDFAHTYGVLMAFAVIFGIFCGSYFALMSPTTALILGMEKFPSGLSLLLLFNVISVFGPNIASAIEGGVHAEPYFSYKMFSGVAYLAGAAILIVLKFRMNRSIFAKI